MNRVLIVEDDSEMNNLMCRFLRGHGFDVTGSLSAEEAYDALYSVNFDLIVSDIMMPKIDGFEFTQTVRQLNENIPILMVTARDDISSKQLGFKLGIDDYMVKPIELDELLMRVKALLRRANINASRKIEIGAFVIDVDATSAHFMNNEITLTLREFNILYKLLSYPNRTFSRIQLMDEFWDVETETTPRAVDVYITKLRDKCSAVTSFTLVTVHGLGYKAVLNES